MHTFAKCSAPPPVLWNFLRPCIDSVCQLGNQMMLFSPISAFSQFFLSFLQRKYHLTKCLLIKFHLRPRNSRNLRQNFHCAGVNSETFRTMKSSMLTPAKQGRVNSKNLWGQQWDLQIFSLLTPAAKAGSTVRQRAVTLLTVHTVHIPNRGIGSLRKVVGHKNLQPKIFSNSIMLSMWYEKVGGHLTHFIQISAKSGWAHANCAHPAPKPLLTNAFLCDEVNPLWNHVLPT